jgi:hypothetical protein
MDRLGRWSRIGASTLKISKFRNSKRYFQPCSNPFGIVAPQRKSSAIVDLFFVNSRKARRYPNRAGERKRKDRFDLRLPRA